MKHLTQKKQKKNDGYEMEQIQKQWDSLEKMQAQQKVLFEEIQQAKVLVAMKSQRYMPYHHAPLYLASYATRGKKPTFYCTACNYITKSKSHFDTHHISKNHRDYLEKWNTQQWQKKDEEKDKQIKNNCDNEEENSNIEYYTSRANRKHPSTKHKEKQITNSNPKQSRKCITNHSTQNNDIQTLKGESITKDINSQVYIKQKEIQAPNMNYKDNTNFTTNNTSDIPPIQWNLKELPNSDNYETAIIKIHKNIPIQFRQNLISLLNTIYQSGTEYEIQFEIRDNFQDNGHWILSKYHKLLKNNDTRKHLQNKLIKKDYDLVSKTIDQEKDIIQIAGAAKIIYDIFIHCHFIPIEYLCLLATLLQKGKDYQYICSSIMLPETYNTHCEEIDLMLIMGAFYLTTREIMNNTTTNDNNDYNIEERFAQTIHITQDNSNHKEHNGKKHTEPKKIIMDDLNELNDEQVQLEKDDLILQVTLQKSFDTLQTDNREVNNPMKTKNIHGNSDIKQNKTRQAWSIQQIMEEHNCISLDDNQDSPTQSKFHNELDSQAIYIKGICQTTTKEDLKELFSPSGRVKKIIRLTASAAIIHFYNSTTAKSAISNLNKTFYKNNKITITLAKKKKTKGTNKKNTTDNEPLNIVTHNQNYDTIDFIQQQRDETLESEVKQELLDIQETFLTQPFENSLHSSYATSIYSIPSLPNSPTTIEQKTMRIGSDIDENQQMILDELPDSPISSHSFHGFESITTYSPDHTNKLSLDQRLEAYRDNAWELIIMENKELPPGGLANISIKVTADNNPNIRPLRNQNDFVIIAALCPYPQINDGIYYTNK